MFLQSRDAPYCLPCLTRAFPYLPVRQRLEQATQGGAPLIMGEGRCAICRLTTTVVAWPPGDLRKALIGQ